MMPRFEVAEIAEGGGTAALRKAERVVRTRFQVERIDLARAVTTEEGTVALLRAAVRKRYTVQLSARGEVLEAVRGDRGWRRALQLWKERFGRHPFGPLDLPADVVAVAD